MYIKKLQHWKSLEWEQCFENSKIELDSNQRGRIIQILCSDNKVDIEQEFDYLYFVGIVNGIGPSWLMKFFRGVITFIFKGVMFEWHDISYFIGGTFLDKLKSDYGLLKYSILGLFGTFVYIKEINISIFAKVFFFTGGIIGGLLQLLIILFCFIMVVLFGSFSFNFIKK